MIKYFIYIQVLFLCSCGIHNSKNTNIQNPPGYLETTAPINDIDGADVTILMLKSISSASKCEQSNQQDRVDCRKGKQDQVDAITKSIQKHTNTN